MQKQYLIILILVTNTFQNEVKSNDIVDTNQSIEDQHKTLKEYIFNNFSSKFEEELLKDILEILIKKANLKDLKKDKLEQTIQNFQDVIDKEILAYYQIDDEQYIEQMKKDRQKYGLTYNVYKLFSEQLINQTIIQYQQCRQNNRQMFQINNYDKDQMILVQRDNKQNQDTQIN